MLQRLRLTFARGEEIKYITHLDIMRLWVRVLRRARVPLAYSQGFTPHPKLSLAAPLAVGVTSEGELMDIELEGRMATRYFLARVDEQLPTGVRLLGVEEVPPTWPSLQAAVRFAEYRVTVQTAELLAALQERIAGLLAAPSLSRERLRVDQVRRYDLRPLIAALRLEQWNAGQAVLAMRLQTDERATGRPDEVLAALNLAEAPRAIHRTRLLLAPPPPPLARRHPGRRGRIRS
jgi:radical SAM-linked protein